MNRDRRAAKAARAARERKTAVPVKWSRCTWPGCHGKRLYRDEGDALVVAVRAAWSGTQRAYPCPSGHGWHLTHRPKRG